MALLDLMQQRRSIRKYLDKPVERDKLNLCLEAAQLAPSACNAQPWKFIVVDDKALKDRLCETAFGGIYSLSSFAREAPVMVAAVADQASYASRVGSLIRNTRFYLIDLGIAGEHFVLQAQELGLGTCWIGWFNERAVKSVLKIPRGKRVAYLLSLGYYDETAMRRTHSRRPIEKIVAFNSYEGENYNALSL